MRNLRSPAATAPLARGSGVSIVASALIAALCGACNPETYAGARAISVQNQYDHLGCDALAANIKASETRIAELKGLMAKAERGGAGSAISNSVYWPQMAQDQANLRIMRETLEGRQECAARR